MPIIFADFGLGEALLVVLEIFFLVIWLWILITILIDLPRDHEVLGWAKAAWVIFLLFIPFITALVYLIVRGRGMRERAIKQHNEAREATDSCIREVAGSSPVDGAREAQPPQAAGRDQRRGVRRMKAKIVA